MVVAAAIIGASVIGAGASIISGGKAAKATVTAAGQAADVQLQLFEQAKALAQPFVDVGVDALGLLSDIFVGGDISQLENLPGFAFALEQGEQAIGRQQAAKGGFLSGAAVKEAVRFAEGLATTTVGQEFNRLFNISALGQSAAAFTGAGAIQTGQGVAQTILTGGEARANQFINIGSSINQGLNNILFGALNFGNVGGSSGISPTPGLVPPPSNVPGTIIPSDERIKENIEPAGEKFYGLNLYRFNYKPEMGFGDKTYIGPMAQEVEKIYPNAVVEFDGLKMIDVITLMEEAGVK